MKVGKLTNKHFLWILLLYSFTISFLNLDYNSVFFDEAYHIIIGHQVLNGQYCPACPYTTGTVLIHPIIAAIGDSFGGLYGARAMNIFIALGLTVIIYLTTLRLFDGKYGLIAALLFMFSGTTLYLAKLATYDMIAAFFLALSFYLILRSEQAPSSLHKNLWLFAASLALFLTSVTKYLMPVFIPALLLYVLWKHKIIRTSLFFLMPLSICLLLYAYFALYPAKAALTEHVTYVSAASHLPLKTLSNWAFRWLAMPYLLAIFGTFHREKGKTAILLIALSTPLLILHFLTGAEQSVNKNVIFSIIFLCPAAALGIDHIGELFSMKSPSPWVKYFFSIIMLVMIWVYGIHDLKWLEKQYPDFSPVVEFLKEKGFNGMTVATNGFEGVIYSYSLDEYFPNAEYIHLYFINKNDDSGRPYSDKVDFIVCDDRFYGKKYPCNKEEYYIENNYTLLKTFPVTLSWGVIYPKIFGRR